MQLVLREEISEWFPNKKPLLDDFMAIKGEVFRSTNNRETLRVVKGNKSYFIKKHFGVGWKEFLKNILQFRLPVFSAKNEWLAIQKLGQLGIPTIALAGYGWCGINPIKQQSFVITEEISNAVSLEEICKGWLRNPPRFSFKLKCIRRIADIARILHNAGLHHQDFYICHFLLDKFSMKSLCEPKLYLIDLHRAQISKEISEPWLIKDIAALYFSALNTKLTQRDIFRFLSNYFAKPWREVIKQYGTFLYKVDKRVKKLHKRISCDSSRFIVKKNWKQWIICDRDYYTKNMQFFLNRPDDFIAHGEILENGDTCTVSKINLEDCQVVVKRYNDKNFWHFINRRIRPSRASICWRNAHLLQYNKILTPRPVAILEERFGPLRGRAYFLSEYIDGCQLLKFMPQITDQNKLKKIADGMIKIFLKLYKQNIKYEDTKATNFIISEDDIYLIDLDSMRKYSPIRYKLNKSFEKDKARFLKNWQNQPRIRQLFLELFDKMVNL
jgi:heptose I phosphotransferase